MAMDGYFFMPAITPYSIFYLITLIIFALSHLLASGELSLFFETYPWPGFAQGDNKRQFQKVRS